MSWIQVTQREFDATILPLEVRLTITGKYGSRTFTYTTPSGEVKGKAIDYMPENKWPPQTKYYINTGENHG
mgnify:FL=1